MGGMKWPFTFAVVIPLLVAVVWVLAALPSSNLSGVSNKALARALGDQPPGLLSGTQVTCTAQTGRMPSGFAFNRVCTEWDYGFLCAPGTGDHHWKVFVKVTGGTYEVVEDHPTDTYVDCEFSG